MNSNILKNIASLCLKYKPIHLCRHLSDFIVSTAENLLAKNLLIEKENEQASQIESNLFNQSSIQHKPVLVQDVLKKKPVNNRNKFIRQNAVSVPTLKKPIRKNRQTECQLINDTELGLEFIKLSLNDPQLSTLMITARSQKRRNKNRQIIIEGRRLIQEALECNIRMQTVLFSQKEKLFEIKDAVARAQNLMETKIYKVPQHDLKLWSTLTTPPGVMAIFERPSLVDTLKKSNNALPITVVCDNIREPNNLGSIIRSCAALPCLQVVITSGCCDPWESKALRGGCGGQFRLPIRDDVNWQDVPLTIPSDTDYRILVAENNLQKIVTQKETTHQLCEYSAIEYTGHHEVLIIGGETHGVSEEAYRFLNTFGGKKNQCIYIPLAAGIDSLNVASALTLILYELRRCILENTKNAALNSHEIPREETINKMYTGVENNDHLHLNIKRDL